MALDQLIQEKELPEKSLYLNTNYGRDGETITSYSVCIYEPDYPLSSNYKKDLTRNSIVINIQESKNRLELLVENAMFEDIEKPREAEIKTVKSDMYNTHVLLLPDSEELVPYIVHITEYKLANYKSKASSFGCCSRFVECSDAKKCVHENKLYSKACSYRTNLELGRIFYGKNRNID